jgi:alpha-L-rhamnosidase
VKGEKNMAFTFQINDDIKFNHDEQLLAKAEANRPILKKEVIKPTRIVEVVEDESKLNGISVIASQKNIDYLNEYGLMRDESLVLDFGDHRVGSFRVEIDQIGSPMDAPLCLRLKFAEMPAELAAESGDYEGWLSRSWIQEEVVHIDELPATLELPRRYSFRYVELKVIDTSPKWQAVFSNPVATTETSADYTKLEPIALEDPELQKIYDVGVKTLADCMQDVFEDGPKRDRRLWLGDLRLQALANYATFDQIDIVKRCLYLFAGMTTEEGKISANVFVKPKNVPDDTFLFEYSLFFISTLYDLHQAHPDLEMVKELYPIAKKQMDITLSMFDEQGRLIPDEDYPVFVDWSNEFNKDTAGQAEVIYVLKQFITLAELAEEKELIKYQEALELISNYAKERLYNKEKQLFVTAGDEYNIASQVWMVLAHVMSEEENKEIMKSTIKELFPVKDIATPYMYHHIVEALFEAGLKEEALRLMKDYWGKMISLGADTYWEAFNPEQPDYSPYGSPIVNSYCHAWSCTPVYLIKKYVL